MWNLAIAITLASAFGVEDSSIGATLNDHCLKIPYVNFNICTKRCEALLNYCTEMRSAVNHVHSVSTGLPFETQLLKCRRQVQNVERTLTNCSEQVYGFLPCNPAGAVNQVCGTVFFTECAINSIEEIFDRQNKNRVNSTKIMKWKEELSANATQIALACFKQPATCSSSSVSYNIAYRTASNETLVKHDLDSQWYAAIGVWSLGVQSYALFANKTEVGCASVRSFKLQQPGTLQRVMVCVYA